MLFAFSSPMSAGALLELDELELLLDELEELELELELDDELEPDDLELPELELLDETASEDPPLLAASALASLASFFDCLFLYCLLFYSPSI